MVQYKYGTFTDSQIATTKDTMRKQIYFLLLIVDPKTRDEYKNVDVNQAFDNLLRKLGGLNDLLFCPPELVTIMSLLQSALNEYNSPSFSTTNFQRCAYRKLVLDAGAEVLNIKEV